MALHCTACGAENLETAQLCYSCGEPIAGRGPEELIGTIMFDSFKLTRVLGQGGMAVVYLGVNQLTEQEVAIKMLPPELAAYAEVKSRFLEEARTLAKLEHPNIVHLINFAEDVGRLCLVMQYAEGETFEELIERLEKVPPDEAVRVAYQVLDGLAHAHSENVVHRDIKPSNIIVRADGSVKVTDFGIAKITRDNKLTQTGQTMGTVRYMAPEQVRGKDIDARTDLYSLGVSLYEAVVGEPPFDGESQFEVMQMHLSTEPRPPREAGADISPQLEAVILKSLAKGQDQRFQSAREMRQALFATPEGKAVRRRVTRESIALASTAAAIEPATAEAPKSRVTLIAVVLGLVVLLAGAATLYFVLRRGKRPPQSPKRSRPAAMHVKVSPALPADHSALTAIGHDVGQWPVKRRFGAPHELYVFADRSVDVDRLAQTYLTTARSEYKRLLTDKAITYEVKVRPLTIALVSHTRLNDRRLWTVDTPSFERTYFYDAQKGLLFSVSDKPFAETKLRYTLAIHFCPLQIDNARCAELARSFETNAKVDLL
ncbi:MAG: serine/threonine-protein kinase [bacterium]